MVLGAGCKVSLCDCGCTLLKEKGKSGVCFWVWKQTCGTVAEIRKKRVTGSNVYSGTETRRGKCSLCELDISLSHLIYWVAVNTKYSLEVTFLFAIDNISVMKPAHLLWVLPVYCEMWSGSQHLLCKGRCVLGRMRVKTTRSCSWDNLFCSCLLLRQHLQFRWKRWRAVSKVKCLTIQSCTLI